MHWWYVVSDQKESDMLYEEMMNETFDAVDDWHRDGVFRAIGQFMFPQGIQISDEEIIEPSSDWFPVFAYLEAMRIRKNEGRQKTIRYALIKALDHFILHRDGAFGVESENGGYIEPDMLLKMLNFVESKFMKTTGGIRDVKNAQYIAEEMIQRGIEHITDFEDAWEKYASGVEEYAA